ncbi:MAG: tetratricopeptide repeat protein [Deltaproteobacteria bacterium]|nr:tetratricopeptide repeat protein [Deltaproteobacteria bacterium]
MPKSKPPRFEEPPAKAMTRAEADEAMERFFAQVQEELKDTPQEVLEVGADRVLDFLKGKLSWAEIFNIPLAIQQRIAEFGYMQFQSGRYEDAERFFKVLCILSPQNSYYYSMMGSILHRQRRDGEAIVWYGQAIDLDPNDIVSLTNRGELFFKHGWLSDAERDFDRAIALDPTQENKWGAQARIVKVRIAQARTRKPGPTKTKGH